MALITTALNRALVPKIYDTIKRDHGEARRFLRLASLIILAAGLVSTLVVWKLLSPIVEAYLGEGFAGAGPVFALLVMCQFIFMAYTSASNVLLYFERNAALSAVTVVTGIGVAWLSYKLTPHFDVMGIALALSAAWAVRWSFTYVAAELQLRKPAPTSEGEAG